MSKRQYFVLTRTLWQGDTWSPVAGPFTNKKEAIAEAEKYKDDGWIRGEWSEQHQAHWADRVVYSKVVSKTVMKRNYGVTYADALQIIDALRAYSASLQSQTASPTD